MNKRGLELAISTLVIIILSVLLLIGLIYILTNGFESFKGATEPFQQSTESIAIKEACNVACSVSDKFAYCCRNFSVGEEIVRCFDARLEVDCDLSCEGFSCS